MAQRNDNTPFSQFVSDLVEEWSQRKFFGIKTNEEALTKTENDFKDISMQIKQIGKRLNTLSAIVRSHDSFGIEAFLPKVEQEYLEAAGMLLRSATILHKWKNRENNK